MDKRSKHTPPKSGVTLSDAHDHFSAGLSKSRHINKIDFFGAFENMSIFWGSSDRPTTRLGAICFNILLKPFSSKITKLAFLLFESLCTTKLGSKN